jgi:HD superfamily phosphohydrolase
MFGYMDRAINLALYGRIDHGPEDDMAWQLYQTHALARLRDISLSSVPSRFAPHGVATSRFQHSVAVGYLARWLCDNRRSLKEYRNTLVASGLCHDTGSAPFSHVSEIFLYDLTKKTHEEQTEDLLSHGTELSEVLERYGVDPLEVVEIVTGRHEVLGPLIAGSIDLDNVSNSIDLLDSLGYRENPPYRPAELVKAFHFRSGKTYLDTAYLKDILGWAEARRRLYALLYSEPNMSAMTMLYRALEFAYANGALKEDFFQLGESAAITFLMNEAGHEAAELIDYEDRWQHYPLLEEQVGGKEDMRLASLYADWKARKDFTDRLAEELNIPKTELSLYVGRSRGEKSITLPFYGDGAEHAGKLFSGKKGKQRLALFAHKKHARLRSSRKVKRVISLAIADLPEAENVDHVFA